MAVAVLSSRLLALPKGFVLTAVDADVAEFDLPYRKPRRLERVLRPPALARLSYGVAIGRHWKTYRDRAGCNLEAGGCTSIILVRLQSLSLATQPDCRLGVSCRERGRDDGGVTKRVVCVCQQPLFVGAWRLCWRKAVEQRATAVELCVQNMRRANKAWEKIPDRNSIAGTSSIAHATCTSSLLRPLLSPLHGLHGLFEGNRQLETL